LEGDVDESGNLVNLDRALARALEDADATGHKPFVCRSVVDVVSSRGAGTSVEDAEAAVNTYMQRSVEAKLGASLLRTPLRVGVGSVDDSIGGLRAPMCADIGASVTVVSVLTCCVFRVLHCVWQRRAPASAALCIRMAEWVRRRSDRRRRRS
jgi:hypothetical protein